MNLRTRVVALPSLVGERSPTDEVTKDALTESTLLDYVRFQSGQERELTGATINHRVAIVDRALRIAFPGAPLVRSAPALQSTYWQRAPMGIGRPRPVLSRLRVPKTAKRTIMPLSVDEVARFWSSFPELTGPGHRGTDAAAGASIARSTGSGAGGFAVIGIADPGARQRQQDPIPAAGPGSNGAP